MNPRTGEFSGQTTTTGGGILSFTAPDTNDWVLHFGGGFIDATPPNAPTGLSADSKMADGLRLMVGGLSDKFDDVGCYPGNADQLSCGSFFQCDFFAQHVL